MFLVTPQGVPMAFPDDTTYEFIEEAALAYGEDGFEIRRKTTDGDTLIAQVKNGKLVEG
jgi:hypothetical protein